MRTYKGPVGRCPVAAPSRAPSRAPPVQPAPQQKLYTARLLGGLACERRVRRRCQTCFHRHTSSAARRRHSSSCRRDNGLHTAVNHSVLDRLWPRVREASAGLRKKGRSATGPPPLKLPIFPRFTHPMASCTGGQRGQHRRCVSHQTSSEARIERWRACSDRDRQGKLMSNPDDAALSNS